MRFDDTLQFNFAGLSCSAVEGRALKLNVRYFLATDLIGATVFDARSGRELPNHEFYRKWVGLTNSQSNANRSKDSALQCTEGFKTHSRATGFRGFLKLSVTVPWS